VTDVVLELTKAQPYPVGLPDVLPLRLALVTLQEKFWGILERHGFDRTVVESVQLEFSFSPSRADDYSCTVSATITGSNGKTYQASV
jgi:hypothetical protein